MKFSILVPVYNVEKYLEQCVESLLNQTYDGEYEIILVDDGSTDSSGTICDRYAVSNSDKIKVIHKENGGHSSARREAIKNATGKYTLFCDSDDFVESTLLETVDNIINDYPDTDMVMYSFCYFEDGVKSTRNISSLNETEVFEDSQKIKLYKMFIDTPYLNSLWTKAIRTEIVKSTPVDYSVLENVDIAEDAYIITHFLTDCKKIVNINEALYNYRTNRNSISRSYNPQKIDRKNMLFLYKRIIDLLPEWEMNTQENINDVRSACFNNAMYLFRMHYEYAKTSKDRKKVLEYNWNSMLFDEIIDNPNAYGSQVNLKLYHLLSAKRYTAIKIWFIKKKLYKTIKSVKKFFQGV